jgi:hypothetical protein
VSSSSPLSTNCREGQSSRKLGFRHSGDLETSYSSVSLSSAACIRSCLVRTFGVLSGRERSAAGESGRKE